MNQKILNYYHDLLEYVKYYNRLSPFPIFDTEYVEVIEEHLRQMENDIEYDKLPVVACKHCKSLHVINDEEENEVCMRCGAINETIIYDNIEVYFDITKPNEKC